MRGGAVAIADLDHNGTAEILYYDQVYDHTGALVTKVGDPLWLLSVRPASFATQMDADPEWEVVNGTRVFDANGVVAWDDAVGCAGGRSGVADMDADGLPEVVNTSLTCVSLTENDGTHTWKYTIPVPYGQPTYNNNAGPPLLANLDGDGDIDIGVASPYYYTVLSAQGVVEWQVVAHGAAPLHSLRTLLDAMGSAARVTLRVGKDSTFDRDATPTPWQAQVFEAATRAIA